MKSWHLRKLFKATPTVCAMALDLNVLHQDMLYHSNVRAMPRKNPYGNWAGLLLVLMYIHRYNCISYQTQ